MNINIQIGIYMYVGCSDSFHFSFWMVYHRLPSCFLLQEMNLHELSQLTFQWGDEIQIKDWVQNTYFCYQLRFKCSSFKEPQTSSLLSQQAASRVSIALVTCLVRQPQKRFMHTHLTVVRFVCLDTYGFGIQSIKSLHYQAVHLLWVKQKCLEWTYLWNNSMNKH